MAVEKRKHICYNILVKSSSVAVAFLTVAVSLFIGRGITAKKGIEVSSAVHNAKTVIIDAGHGGFDGGAVAKDGTVEKEINLSIAKKVKQILLFNGYNVIMTRNSDVATNSLDGSIASKKKSDLKNRLELMNKHKSAVYVSIHLNKFTTSAAYGAQVFYSKNFEEAKELGQSIQNSIVSLLQKDNKRAIKQGTKSTYLLYNATVPAVIVECGFLSNNAELEMLKDKTYQSKMAFAVSSGIINYKG